MKYTTVLVVDDSVTIRAMLQVLLERDAHLRIVGIASNAQQAFQLIKEVDPDVVTLDIAMPDIDGFETLRALRTQPGMANVFAIAVTGYGSQDDKRRTLEAGFDGHLTKPAELDALVALLNEAGAGSKIPEDS